VLHSRVFRKTSRSIGIQLNLRCTLRIGLHPVGGRSRDPETIDKMSEALKGVCETLSLKLVDGPEKN